MHIVVLDYPETCTEMIPWDAFEELGKLSRYVETSLPELLPRAETADVLITRHLPLRREVLDYLTHVRTIVVPAESATQLVEMAIARQLGLRVLAVATAGRDTGQRSCNWWNSAVKTLRQALRDSH